MTLHMNMKKRRKHRDSLRRFFLAGAVLLSAGALSACGSKEAALNESTSLAPPVVLMEETLPQTAADETVMALTPDGPLLPSVAGVSIRIRFLIICGLASTIRLWQSCSRD